MPYADAIAAGQPGKGGGQCKSQPRLAGRIEAKIDINSVTDYEALKEMQTKNERHDGE
jgi:hypothetical protein